MPAELSPSGQHDSSPKPGIEEAKGDHLNRRESTGAKLGDGDPTDNQNRQR